MGLTVALVIGVVCVAAYVWRQLHMDTPALDMRVFAQQGYQAEQVSAAHQGHGAWHTVWPGTREHDRAQLDAAQHRGRLALGLQWFALAEGSFVHHGQQALQVRARQLADQAVPPRGAHLAALAAPGGGRDE